MIPPPGTSGTGSPLNAVDKTKRPDNSIFSSDSFPFMDGMTRNDDSSRMWSHKSGDGFGKSSNFSEPVGPSLGSIGSHPHNSNDAKVDNAFASQMNFGPAGFFGNGNGNNPPPSSNFGSGLNGPFGNLGGLGGNGNGSGDGNPSLPPFPLLWGNSGLNLKNVGSSGLGGFQTNSESTQSASGDLPDSSAGNWNGSVPRS